MAALSATTDDQEIRISAGHFLRDSISGRQMLQIALATLAVTERHCKRSSPAVIMQEESEWMCI